MTHRRLTWPVANSRVKVPAPRLANNFQLDASGSGFVIVRLAHRENANEANTTIDYQLELDFDLGTPIAVHPAFGGEQTFGYKAIMVGIGAEFFDGSQLLSHFPLGVTMDYRYLSLNVHSSFFTLTPDDSSGIF